MAVWRIELLGGLQAKSHGREVSRFRTRRVAMLLAYLALHRGRLYPRDELVELLWPDTDEEAGRRNLRQALHSLRKVLEPPSMPAGSVLLSKHSLLGLNPETVGTDVGEMEGLVEQARAAQGGEEKLGFLKKALALYRGDLLPGMEELWVMNERFRVEDLYLSSLRKAIEACESLGRGDEAIDYLRLAIEKEPLNQDWHLALMRQYLALNRPGSAVKQFEELEQLLREELDFEPDVEAQELVRRARAELGGDKGRGVPVAGRRMAEGRVDEVGEVAEVQVRLPVQLTRLFGRTEEIESVRQQVMDGERLVTILGPAGTGKTRLSVEVARKLGADGWEVWFVPLADVDDPEVIFERILDTIQPRGDRKNALGQIRDLVAGKRVLFVLDNYEHLVEEGAVKVSELLAAVPALSCLVSSRWNLGVEGERLFHLKPLAVPAAGMGLKVETRGELAKLAEYPSVQLLVDRFQAIRPDVQITLQNARHFAAICEKLEGIPLALEIAAGLSKTSTPGQIVKQLENRLLALTSRRRDITPRHRSLRAAIDYGYHALTPKLQSLFAALSVFRGGFSVEAARVVCSGVLGESSGGVVSREACLDALLDLQERSFLQSLEPESDELDLRFRMLESFREYGEEQLGASEAEGFRACHAAFYLANCLAPEEENDPQARARLCLLVEADYDNFVAALEFFFARREASSYIRLLVGITTAWDVRGTKSSEENMIRQAIQLPETQGALPHERVRLLRMLATTYLRKSEFAAAFEACQRALVVAKETQDDGLIAACYFGMSLCAGHMGREDECLELGLKVLEHAPQSDGVLLERTYVSIGSVHWGRDDLEEAEKAFLEARRVSEEIREFEPDPLILAHLAGVILDQGRLDEGMVLANEGIRLSQSRGNMIALAASLAEVARFHWKKGDLVAAMATNRKAMVVIRDVGIAVQCYAMIRRHALLLVDTGEMVEGVTLIAATRGAETVERNLDRREVGNALDQAREGLSHAAFEEAWADGLAMSLDEAFRTALHRDDD